MVLKIKDDQGHFTYLSKVIAMISATVTVLVILGGAAFQIDERHAHKIDVADDFSSLTIEVAGQFKSIQDSRQVADLQNALNLTVIRLDILEDRLFREQQKGVKASQEYIQKLKTDIFRLNKQFDQINEKLLDAIVDN